MGPRGEGQGTFGARIIAQALKDLGVQVIFGLPGYVTYH